MSYTGKKARFAAIKAHVRVASAGNRKTGKSSGIVNIDVALENDKQRPWTDWRPDATEPVDSGHVGWKLFRHPVSLKDKNTRVGSCGLLIWSTTADKVEVVTGGRMDSVMSTVGTSRDADYVSYQVVTDIK